MGTKAVYFIFSSSKIVSALLDVQTECFLGEIFVIKLPLVIARAA